MENICLSKKFRILLLLFVFFFSLTMVSAGNVTRSFSVPSVVVGQELEVELFVDIDEGDPGETYYYVLEEVPVGWNIISAPGAIEIDGQNITWAYGPNPSDTTLTYTTIPSTTGMYQFEGVYGIGSPILFEILGDEFIQVVQIITCYDDDDDGFDTCPIGHPGGDPFEEDCVDDPAGQGGIPGDQINPGVVEEGELCDDGVDNDCDGDVDGDDDGCVSDFDPAGIGEMVLGISGQVNPATEFIPDSSIYGNNATCEGLGCPFWGDGAYGQAYYFDGVDDLLEIDSSVSIDFNPNASSDNSSNYTYVFWLKASDYSDFSLFFDHSCEQGVGGLQFGHTFAGGLVLVYCGPNPASTLVGNVGIGSWSRIVVRVKSVGDTHLIEGYINGILTFNSTRTLIANGGTEIFMGAGHTPVSGIDYGNATLDEFRVYREYLSDYSLDSFLVCLDEDGDGWNASVGIGGGKCGPLPDCADNNGDINPTVAEDCFDGVDNDCDGDVDGYDPDCYGVVCVDNDFDGFDTCQDGDVGGNPDGKNPRDCDDSDGFEYPGQRWYTDDDMDLYAPQIPIARVSCARPGPGWIPSEDLTVERDCNDTDPDVNPGMEEVCDDLIDNDCNGFCDGQGAVCIDGALGGDPACGGSGECIDNDEDGWNSTAGPCGPEADCDDDDPREHPGQRWNIDFDMDLYGTDERFSVVLSCVSPGAEYNTSEELIGGLNNDCNDTNYSINPGVVEEEVMCFDGMDNDCDGLVDGDDPDCVASVECFVAQDCVPLEPIAACGYWTCEENICIKHGNDLLCDDGAYCNGVEWCDFDLLEGDGCMPGEDIVCDDEVDCTVDNCNEGTDSCDFEPDNNLCVGEEICHPMFGCGELGDCGNGIVEFGEWCDGTNLSMESCESQDYPAGNISEDAGLSCYPSSHPLNCSFNYSSCSLLPDYDKFNGTTTNFTDVGETGIGNVLDSLLEINDSGLLNYSGSGLNYTRLDLDEYVVIEFGMIGVDLTGNMMSELNATGYLDFYDINYNDPILLRNGQICPEEVCNITNYTKGEVLKAEVKGFSVYEVAACGDGRCGPGENNANCPADCPSSPSDPGGPEGSCFPAGTLIMMADGSEKEIEDLMVGESVLSYDEFNDKIVEGVILELESPVRDHMCELIFDDVGRIELTNEHPIYTEEGWKSIEPLETRAENALLEVGKLDVGDLVMFVDGWGTLDGINCWSDVVKTYNLKSIFPYGNYFAGQILAHNKGGPPGPWNQGGDPECNDGMDNDNDTLVDYPQDPGCDSPYDDDESPFDQLVGPGGCDEQWACTTWSECDENNVKTRECYDENGCGTELEKPDTVADCGTPALVGAVRLDIVFASAMTVLSIAGLIVGIAIWMKRRMDTGAVKKEDELSEAAVKFGRR